MANYTPSDQIRLQQEMSQQLMNRDMRQGLSSRQPTDWGRGLAHMLNQYQGGKLQREGVQQLEDNNTLQQQDNSLMAELLANPEGKAAPDFSNMAIAQGLDPNMVQGAQEQAVDLPSMSQAQFNTPQGQQMQLGQIGRLNAENRAQTTSDANAERNHQYALELQGLKNDKTSGYTSTPRPIATDQGYMEYKDGQWVPMLDGEGNTRLSAQYSPELQGNIVSAKETAEAESAKEFNMRGMEETLGEAEKLLSLTGDDMPTHSGMGSMVDSAAGFFGRSPDGAVAAQKLRVIGGVLTGKVPRFEGPQSDADAKLYRQTAGEIGDESLPIERRKAALKTVKRLTELSRKQMSQAKFSSMSDEDLFN